MSIPLSVVDSYEIRKRLGCVKAILFLDILCILIQDDNLAAPAVLLVVMLRARSENEI